MYLLGVPRGLQDAWWRVPTHWVSISIPTCFCFHVKRSFKMSPFKRKRGGGSSGTKAKKVRFIENENTPETEQKQENECSIPAPVSKVSESNCLFLDDQWTCVRVRVFTSVSSKFIMWHSYFSGLRSLECSQIVNYSFHLWKLRKC